MPLLERINMPEDLKPLNIDQLETLAKEIHAFLLDTVSKTGGHLSSNLGTIELTLALYKIFNFPIDKLIWDVGHQSYTHKILTGRKDKMGTLRQKDGISGFPKRDESVYDAFGTAHSSTSLSAALGMAVAARQLGLDRQHIAVIGDGAMTAGMVFEAMNHAGDLKGLNLLVILNDNEMSISPPVGALNRYLIELSSAKLYKNAKEVVHFMPAPLVDLAKRVKDQAKHFVEPHGSFFETFGFDYSGPIDGHDLSALLPALEHLKQQGGLQFLHVVTKKGNGYKLAENNSVLYHGVGSFNPQEGIKTNKVSSTTYTHVFSHWLEKKATEDTRLMAITPAMKEGSGLVEFAKTFPNRYFDVGIAEQHSVTFAAGLACDGLKPVVAIYSTFLQRAYDQLIHDVALQNLNVTFAVDRAGLVGPDGATHAGNYDIAYLRCIPNMVIATPSDEFEMSGLLTTCYEYKGPAVVRYPRTSIVQGDRGAWDISPLPMAARVLREGQSGVALLAFGPLLNYLHSVAQQIDATLVDMRFVKPLDKSCLLRLARSHSHFITVEDSAIEGGAGQAVASCLSEHDIYPKIHHIGLPDRYIHQGERHVLMKELGLDEEGLTKRVLALLEV